jgi:hypothetical protein
MSSYGAAHSFRRAEPILIFTTPMIADARCHVCLVWADSTRTTLQPTARIIHTSLTAFNRGAAGINCESMRSADITPELTGRAHNTETIQVDDKS